MHIFLETFAQKYFSLFKHKYPEDLIDENAQILEDFQNFQKKSGFFDFGEINKHKSSSFYKGFLINKGLLKASPKKFRISNKDILNNAKKVITNSNIKSKRENSNMFLTESEENQQFYSNYYFKTTPKKTLKSQSFYNEMQIKTFVSDDKFLTSRNSKPNIDLKQIKKPNDKMSSLVYKIRKKVNKKNNILQV